MSESISTRKLEEEVRKAIAGADLDALVCALVLQTGYHDFGWSPWATEIRPLLERARPAEPLRRAGEVAVAGIIAALTGGLDAPAAYLDAARRELSREPLAPAVCVRDEERLLLGISAGIGIAAPLLEGELRRILQGRAGSQSVRGRCMDLWALSLASGAPRLNRETAVEGMRVVSATRAGGDVLSEADRIALLWLSTRVLDAPWNPTDGELEAIDDVLRDGRRSLSSLATDPDGLSPLDSALILDAFRTAPRDRIARRGAIESVLAIIDHFAASASIVGARHASRTPFLIGDEYDVQDLFHVLTKPVVPDLVSEDPAPQVAGKSTRLDFTSKDARLGLEMKHVRNKTHASTVREEILLDEATYQEHPYVDTVVAFVHDPQGFIAPESRTAFERDLSQSVTIGGRTVQYITRVR